MKKMAELLLEILSEEIPARLQLRGVEDLKSLVCTKLKDQDLSFDSVLAHVGPRRLVLVVDGLRSISGTELKREKAQGLMLLRRQFWDFCNPLAMAL